MTSSTAPAPTLDAPPPGHTPPENPRRRAPRSQTTWIWVFLLPTVVLYGMYTLWPIAASYWYSLEEWNGFTSEGRFVGLSNYRAVIADPGFWSSMRITLVFMLIVAPARVLLSLVLAIVLNSPRLPLRGLFRTVYFLPVVTTTAIVGVVMQFIFDPGAGPVNSALRFFGISEGIDFLGSSDTALYTAAGIYTWKFFGITMIYWLAALQTIPEEVSEAAKIDGANALQNLRYITLPMLFPFLLIISVLTVEDCFRAFDLMQTMTGGGPFFSTEVIEIYIYRYAFAATVPQLGFASAAAVLFGLVVLVVAALQAWGLVVGRRKRAALR